MSSSNQSRNLRQTGHVSNSNVNVGSKGASHVAATPQPRLPINPQAPVQRNFRTPAQTVEQQLKAVNAGLQTLQDGLIAQLLEDVEWLKQEKFALQQEINLLRQQRQQLTAQQLTAQQIAQQQQWAKQFAQILAQHLQQQLLKQFGESLGGQSLGRASLGRQISGRQISDGQISDGQISGGQTSESVDFDRIAQINQLLLSLDATLARTFQTLQAELNQYQTILNQQFTQINEHVNDRGQQVEFVLETLLQKLRQNLDLDVSAQLDLPDQALAQDSYADPSYPAQHYPDSSDSNSGYANFKTTRSGVTTHPVPVENLRQTSQTLSQTVSSAKVSSAKVSSPLRGSHPSSLIPQSGVAQQFVARQPIAPQKPYPDPYQEQRSPPHPETIASVRRKRLGITLATFSALALALQYVLTDALFQSHTNFALWPINAVFEPTWSNTLLALWLRMFIVIPLITLIGRGFYGGLWQDLRSVLGGTAQSSSLVLGMSGSLLFLSQWLLYWAVGQTSAGIGVTLFFVYPAILALLSWVLTGDRPTQFRIFCLIALGVGSLCIFSLASGGAIRLSGLLVGCLSGVTFALYLLVTGLCSRKLHPLVVTIVQFSIAFLLASLIWLAPPEISREQFQSFLFGGLFLGLAATLSYLFNTISVRLMGAMPNAVISNAAPFLTVLLSLVLFQEGVSLSEGLGVLLITLGAVALSLERFKDLKKRG